LSAIVGGWWQCAKLKGGFGLTFVLLKINNTVGSAKNHSGLARPMLARLQNGATENDLWAALFHAAFNRSRRCASRILNTLAAQARAVPVPVPWSKGRAGGFNQGQDLCTFSRGQLAL
jgi:hypothetical protein